MFLLKTAVIFKQFRMLLNHNSIFLYFSKLVDNFCMNQERMAKWIGHWLQGYVWGSIPSTGDACRSVRQTSYSILPRVDSVIMGAWRTDARLDK